MCVVWWKPLEDMDPFSFDEIIAFLDFLKTENDMFYNLVDLWHRTGPRPGEICGLMWQRIDYFNKKMLIRATRSNNMDGPPKTASSIRDIDLSPAAIDALKRQEKHTLLQNSYVFMSENGNPLSVEGLASRMRHLMKRAGVRARVRRNISVIRLLPFIWLPVKTSPG